MSIDQRGCEGGLLVRIKHMCEIEGHADIREIHFLKGKERRRAVRHQAIGTRLIRLVLDADEAVWIVQRDLANALDLICPEPRITGLKGVVEAILSREVVRRFGERELVAKAALDGRTSARLSC